MYHRNVMDISNNKKIKVLYGLLIFVFWMTDASISTFTSAYLLHAGFSNTMIGFVLGASGLVSVFAQPITANMLDQSKKINVMEACIGQFIISMTFLFILFNFKTSTLATAIMFVLSHTITLSSIPLIHSIFFIAKRYNPEMNFGLFRAFGCVGFSLSSFICGKLINKYSGGIVPLIGLIICFLTTVLLVILDYYCRFQGNKTERKLYKENNISFKEFILNNKYFVLVNIAIAMFCIVNKVMGSFILQIIIPLGGSTADQGTMSTMWSFFEMFPMFLFGFISSKLSYRNIILIAGFANAIKAFGLFFAKTIPGIYVALFFQMFSQGFFNPCIVPYLNSCVTKKEAIRAQSLHTALLSIDTILLSGIGGIVIDTYGIKALTFTCFVVVLIGAILFSLLTKNDNKNNC